MAADPKPPAPKTEDAPVDDETDDELLDVGQEEVFSRAEVELGVIEHSAEAGRQAPKP